MKKNFYQRIKAEIWNYVFYRSSNTGKFLWPTRYIGRWTFQGDDELSNPYDAAMEALKAEHKNETQRLQEQVEKYKEQVDESEKERKELKSQNKERRNKIKELESRIKDMQSESPPTQIVMAAAPAVAAASEETTTETGAVCVCVFACVCACVCVLVCVCVCVCAYVWVPSLTWITQVAPPKKFWTI